MRSAARAAQAESPALGWGARQPIGIYPAAAALQLLFTYVLPIAFVATVPAEVLLSGDASSFAAQEDLGALAVSLAACALAWLIWRRALRRYTSATS
ncbi:ABC-2 family transporter protein [Nonomuraea sp. NPDC048892]|uniref:ABC-2 family transporter protein n=1 Tax=Nonomuraea sp. NPDC048892 TaxID=3154624 RepID=UPI0033C12E62